jgi:hypothetical protein
MKYLRIYYQLVAQTARQGREGYVEIHHIVPRSVFGTGLMREDHLKELNDPNNLVKLTAREHYVAHWLLARAFPDSKPLIGAFWAMTNFAKPEGKKRNYTVSSRAFEEARIAFSATKHRPLIQYDLEGNFVRVHPNHMEALSDLGILGNGIKLENKSCGGFMWRDFQSGFPMKIQPYTPDDAGKRIVQLSPDGSEFLKTHESAVKAASELGLLSNHISSCCTGTRGSSGGFMWLFEEDYDYTLPEGKKSKAFYQSESEKLANERSATAKHKLVAQYSLKGSFIQIFDSIKDASIQTKTDRISIGDCCRGKSKSANGFLWSFSHGYTPDTIEPYKRSRRSDSYLVGQYDLQGNLISVFENLSAVSIVADRTAVHDVIAGGSKTANGFLWTKYDGKSKIAKLSYQYNRGLKVLQLDKKTEEVLNEYLTMTEAAAKTGTHKSGLGKCLNGERATANGFKWKYSSK